VCSSSLHRNSCFHFIPPLKMPDGVNQAVLLPSYVHFSSLVNIFLFLYQTEWKYLGHVFLNPAHQTPSYTVLAAAVTPRPTNPSRPDPAWSGPEPQRIALSSLSSIPVTHAASVPRITASTAEQRKSPAALPRGHQSSLGLSWWHPRLQLWLIFTSLFFCFPLCLFRDMDYFWHAFTKWVRMKG